ncbi:hypothetical protein ACFWDQ_17550 [Streptomyces sp. NPDC060053]|uniref:hypothetical protein n=1 Tax=Streptomyces sp. NPDC060053 TaxID=3347047 RepID=UPI0036B62F71
MSRHNKRRSKLQKRMTVFGGGTVAVAAVVATVNVASAGQVSPTVTASKADHAVFVQGNELAGNTIHVFRRGDDGKLTAAGEYATGGMGGDQVDAPTDSLASQGSLVYATSGTVDGFRVGHDGALTKVTTVTGLPAFAESGMEGIAAV